MNFIFHFHSSPYQWRYQRGCVGCSTPSQFWKYTSDLLTWYRYKRNIVIVGFFDSQSDYCSVRNNTCYSQVSFPFQIFVMFLLRLCFDIVLCFVVLFNKLLWGCFFMLSCILIQGWWSNGRSVRHGKIDLKISNPLIPQLSSPPLFRIEGGQYSVKCKHVNHLDSYIINVLRYM